MIEHAAHELAQVGPCVYCVTCNVRLFQGRLGKDREQTLRSMQEIVAALVQVAEHADRVRRCKHRILSERVQGDGSRWRYCHLCGHAVDLSHWQRLERKIRDKYRLPPSPWSAQERATDTD